MNKVVIPCFNRPEFLFWCLEKIKIAEKAAENKYIFCLDYGYDTDNVKIINEFPFSKEIVRRNRHLPLNTKQSRNVLEGLRYAAETSINDIIYLIEDDVMIANDYFIWHEKVHASNVFCAIASKNINRHLNKGSNRLSDYYLSNGDYCGIGTSFKAGVIEKHIVPHINDSYYSDCIKYVIQHWPDSTIGAHYSEQDGLIRRIQSESGLPTAYPFVPRAYHAGFYGKGRDKKMYIANLPKRIKAIGEIIFDKTNMAKFALNEYFYFDSEPVSLTNRTDYNIEEIKL